jgi:hypothetical protein
MRTRSATDLQRKAKALRLLELGVGAAEVARRLDMPAGTVRSWAHRAAKAAPVGTSAPGTAKTIATRRPSLAEAGPRRRRDQTPSSSRARERRQGRTPKPAKASSKRPNESKL